MFPARQIDIRFPYINRISAGGSYLIVLHIEGPELEHNAYNITDEGCAQDIDVSLNGAHCKDSTSIIILCLSFAYIWIWQCLGILCQLWIFYYS